MALTFLSSGRRLTAAMLRAAIGDPARKTANESVTSSTVLQADDQLFLSVTINATYLFDSFIIADGAAAGGLKMQFTGPSGAVFNWGAFGVNFGGALNDYDVVMQTLAAGAPRAVGLNGATAMCCQPKGVLTTAGNSGTFQFNWAQNTSSVTATRVLALSYIRLIRIA